MITNNSNNSHKEFKNHQEFKNKMKLAIRLKTNQKSVRIHKFNMNTKLTTKLTEIHTLTKK